MDHYVVKHWFPVITFCPVNKMPDFLYVNVAFPLNRHHDLYEVRKLVRRITSFKTLFMEDIAKEVLQHFPDGLYVEVTLMFGKHYVQVFNKNQE